MRRLNAFNFVTLNGFFKGMKEDISWHKHGAEESEYSAENLATGNILLFGRVTFEMMANYWPTPLAMQNDPAVSKGMNTSEKIVFSRSLKNVSWQNSKIMSDDIVKEIREMKNTTGKDMTILGSGSIVTQFTEHGLIDEIQIMVDPVLIGQGVPIFQNIQQSPVLKLKRTRAFKSGTVLLYYEVVH